MSTVLTGLPHAAHRNSDAPAIRPTEGGESPLGGGGNVLGGGGFESVVLVTTCTRVMFVLTAIDKATTHPMIDQPRKRFITKTDPAFVTPLVKATIVGMK